MNKLLIITYHYVRKYDKQFPNLKVLNLREFKKQLNFIKKKFNVLDYFQILKFLKTNEKFPSKSCWLTFDDGYLDHYKYVLPELKKRGMKGSFFPVAKSTNNNIILEVNKIQHILAKKKNPNLIFDLVEDYTLKNFTRKENLIFKRKYFSKNVYDDIKTSYIKKMLQFGIPNKERTKLINSLFKNFVNINEKQFSKKLYMKKFHLKKLINEGMHVGGHGDSHIRLGLASNKIQEREIRSTKKFLKSIKAETKDWLMCYPYGSFNNDTKKILKKNGCKMALTVIKGKMDFSKNELLEIPRVDTNEIRSRVVA